MTAANRLAELEAERWAPVPRRTKPAGPKPVTEAEAARHRRELLEAVYGTRTDSPARAGREPHGAMPNAA